MRDERHNLTIGQVGDGEPPYEAYDGDHKKGSHIAYGHKTPLQTGERTGGEHHQRYDQKGKGLTQDVEPGIEIPCPDKREGRKQEIEDGEMEQSVGTEVCELTFEIPLRQPIDKKERPRQIHHEVGADGTAGKEGKKEYVECAEKQLFIVLIR